MKVTKLLSAAVFCALTSFNANAATLNNQFLLDGDTADTLSNGTASLGAGSGTLDADSFNFSAGQGLHVALGSTLSTWSIVMDVAFDSISGYRKLIDIAALGSDNGLYNLNGQLNYYNTATGPSGAFAASQFSQVALTYDGTTTRGYINGVQQISFTTSGSGYPTAISSLVAVRDDNATSNRENSSGDLLYLEVYDGALSGSEVAALDGPASIAPVPLPATGLLLIGALGGMGLIRRRRKPT